MRCNVCNAEMVDLGPSQIGVPGRRVACPNLHQPWHINQAKGALMARTADSYYVTTATGKLVYLDDPKDFDIIDIAIGLSNICRWGGQMENHWSVAQHSLALCYILSLIYPGDKPLCRAALLHDAAEAYIGDITRPVLRFVGGNLQTLKNTLEAAVEHQFNFNGSDQRLKRWDDQIIHVEAEIFGLKKHPACQQPIDLLDSEWDMAKKAITGLFMGMSIPQARHNFLNAYFERRAS